MLLGKVLSWMNCDVLNKCHCLQGREMPSQLADLLLHPSAHAANPQEQRNRVAGMLVQVDILVPCGGFEFNVFTVALLLAVSEFNSPSSQWVFFNANTDSRISFRILN